MYGVRTVIRTALAVSASLLAFTGAAYGASGSESVWLTQITHIPVQCFDTSTAYKILGATVIPSSGFWDYNATVQKGVIGLTPATCNWLSRARQGDAGGAEDTAIFDLSHEMAHASGADLQYAATHATDPVFVAQTAAIAASYPAVNAAREAAADCVGLHNAASLAAKFGMAHWAFNATDIRWISVNDGYVQIPAECAS